jgi:predicted glycosyltransferase
MFDYEFAATMHHWNGRLAGRVLVPAAIPERALARYGLRPPKLVRYPGLKEEYYLADHEVDPGVAAELGLDPGRAIAVVRPPPEVTLYHRGASTDLFAATLARLLAAAPGVQTVVLPRTAEQRRALEGRAAVVPAEAVDGPSLVAAADVVVSAGGTMNREAAALGVPAYTPFAARLGAVDRRLIDEGRLRRLQRPQDVPLGRRDRGQAPPLRDPEVLLDLILQAGRARVPHS